MYIKHLTDFRNLSATIQESGILPSQEWSLFIFILVPKYGNTNLKEYFKDFIWVNTLVSESCCAICILQS